MPHIHEKIDFTVEVFIVYKDKVLLRKHDKLKIWLSVGGHIELDEDPNEAALREVKEEVGLDVELVGNKGEYKNDESYRELIAPRYLGRNQYNEHHEHIAMVYFAKAKDTNISVSYKGDRSDECVWATLEDLEKMDLVNNVKFYAKEALKELANELV
ncbi:MAG TPA: NUDIX domain-containing protein [Candidatus Paceibacterota bacterium]|nr:NUDIX domain-containing protein [Candidatus Paceibacterota bacterium]